MPKPLPTLTPAQRQAILDMVANLGDAQLCDIAYLYGCWRSGGPMAPAGVLEAALLKCDASVEMYRTRAEPQYEEALRTYEEQAEHLRSILTVATPAARG